MSEFAHPDFLPTMSPIGGALADPPPGATFSIPLERVNLVELCESGRFFELDKYESYLYAAQDFAKRYDWDGKIVSDGAAPMHPGWVVPLAQRKPCARYDLSKVIVKRFTALLFGTERFPEFTTPGDPEAEEYVKGILEATRFQLRSIHARNLGGATGGVGMSFAVIEGKLKVEVHNAKHCTTLDWRDRTELRPSAVLKAYKFPKRVFDPTSNKLKMVDYFYVRLWTEAFEQVWEPIPFSIANTTGWSGSPSQTVAHPFRFCPFYWAQNLPNDEDEDGFSDYHGLLDNLDEMNRLTSAAVRAVKANSDPTFVVKIDPQYKEEQIQKGQGAAIFSPGGAEYVVLPPHTIEAITKTKEDLRQATLDTASVVVADPEKLAGAAQSAAAMRILYAPMLAQCDIYREQYGELLIKPMIRDILRACRILIAAGMTVDIPPRVQHSDDGKTSKVIDRLPGKSDHIVLNWNPYFTPTWTDIKSASEAAKLANGDKPIISQRTAIAATQSLWGVENVDDELVSIHDEADEAMERANKAMGLVPGEGPQPAGLEGKGPPIPPASGTPAPFAAPKAKDDE